MQYLLLEGQVIEGYNYRISMIRNVFEGDLVWVDSGAGNSPGWGLVVGYREVRLYDHNAMMIDYTVLLNDKVVQLSQTQLKRMSWSNQDHFSKCSKIDGSLRKET